mmetsp:Transcript_14964/g.37671  ORF Transcript_14964/g.37671 Transcript_14964/m.37671 type:complete len:275 (-) Transcript_14964:1940-2764(-)
MLTEDVEIFLRVPSSLRLFCFSFNDNVFSTGSLTPLVVCNLSETVLTSDFLATTLIAVAFSVAWLFFDSEALSTLFLRFDRVTPNILALCCAKLEVGGALSQVKVEMLVFAVDSFDVSRFSPVSFSDSNDLASRTLVLGILVSNEGFLYPTFVFFGVGSNEDLAIKDGLTVLFCVPVDEIEVLSALASLLKDPKDFLPRDCETLSKLLFSVVSFFSSLFSSLLAVLRILETTFLSNVFLCCNFPPKRDLAAINESVGFSFFVSVFFVSISTKLE